MFRLSRIHAPRATFAAVALLAVVLLAFGLVANAHVAEPSMAVVPSIGEGAVFGFVWRRLGREEGTHGTF